MTNGNLKILEGERVRLRPITMDDTNHIVEWRNNPEVRKNFVFRTLFTPEIHEAWMRGPVEQGKVCQFIIEIKNSKKPIGSIYLRDIDLDNESAEYGIFIGEDESRGQGYGTEAAQLALKYAFSTLKLHRVYLRVFANNPQAVQSYKKAGFQQEGLFKDFVKIDGHFFDMIFMAILSREESGH